MVLPSAAPSAGRSAVVLPGPARGPIPDVALRDVMAHSLGLAALRPAETHSFFSASANPLTREKLGVLLAVDGLGSGAELSSVAEMLGGTVAKIEETAVLQDNAALLASVVTGVSVAQHGVVGESYVSTDGVRHSQPSRRAATLGDRSGTGSVFVASASERLARLMTPLSVSVGGKSVSSYSWSDLQGQFLAHTSYGDNVKPEAHFPRAKALMSAADVALFPESDEHNVAFLAELEFLLSSSASFEAASSAAPAFFGFAVSTVKKFHGSKLFAATRALDQALVKAVKNLEQRFGSVAWQIVLLDQQPVMTQAQQALSLAASSLRGLAVVRGGIDVYATTSDACVALNKLLWTHELVAYCRPAAPKVVASRSVVFALQEPPVSNTTGSDITLEDVVAFQLLFWLGVMFAIVFATAACSISGLDIPSDSPLVRNLPDIYRPTTNLRELM